MKKTPLMFALISGLVAAHAASADLAGLYSPYADLSVKRFARPVEGRTGYYPEARVRISDDVSMPENISYSSYGTVDLGTVEMPEMDLSYTITTPKKESVSHTKRSVGNIVLDLINEKYYGFIPPKTMGMMPQTQTKEMVALLEDPYSEFIPASEIMNQVDPFEKQYNGIGVHLVDYEGSVYVYTVVPNGSAYQAGMKSGDRVVNINGISVDDITLDEIAGLIQGEPDTYVKIAVERKGKIASFILKRANYTMSGVDLYWQDNIPVLKLQRFDMPAVNKALSLLGSEPVMRSKEGLILDMRGNQGGTVSSAVALAELFTYRRQPMFSTEDTNGVRAFYQAQQDGVFSRKDDVVILQNGQTASAAEMFTSLMQDSGKAHVIGIESKGKNTVQEVFLLHDGSILKLTVARWLKADGTMISEDGIIPNERVTSGSLEEQLFDGDLQLQAAVEYINS